MHPLPAINHFNKLLAAIVRMKHYSTVVSLFKEMCAARIPVDICTMTTVISCYCHLDRVDYGFAVLAGVFKGGYVPDVFTYSTLIRALFRDNKVVEAVELFEKLI